MTDLRLCDRRDPHVLDRRRCPRGGRRATDALRYAAWVAVVTLATVSTAEAQVSRGWTTSGTRILTPAGNELVIGGINWWGFEGTDAVVAGLWTKDYTIILDQVKQYGYNTIRLPFSNQMWETNPLPSNVSACPSCTGKRSRDIMAMIINYAGSIGLHVILDNHRSTAGSSAQESGLWYTSGYPEQSWIRDWVSVQEWVHGIRQTMGAADTITVNTFASDGFPTVLGFDLRNEPHAPSAYLSASTWGTGDGIDPWRNPNPNPFTPACVAMSSCHDWRLAAERAADTLLGEAVRNGWEYPLIFVEGVGAYPTDGGTAASGPYDYYWWGGNLLGVNGHSTNPGAPIVLNAGGDATALGPPVYNQLVYSTHDYGPSLYKSAWFNSSTCYATGCSSSSLADIWKKYWAHLVLPGGINPVWPGQPEYPWSNTGHTAITQAPIFIGEFGTGNSDTDLFTSGAGSQGQWMTSIVNFVASSHQATKTALNDSGVPVTNLHWTYWTLDTSTYGLLGRGYEGLANAKKEYSFLCFIQQGQLAVPMGSTTGSCGSTGTLPLPDSSAPSPEEVPLPPTSLTAIGGDAQVTLTWNASSGATSYTVRSNANGGEVFEIVQSGVTTTTVIHTGLTNGVTYSYIVSAVNSAGESGASNVASATPTVIVVSPPAAPTGLSATAGDGRVQLSWTAVNGATSYTVKYTVNGGPSQIAAAGVGSTNFTHTGLTNGTTYSYIVSASNAGGTSPDSTPVSATPTAATQAVLSIWTPTDGYTITGGMAFKAKLENMELSAYKMYWHLDGGSRRSMYNKATGGPHKEDYVKFGTWSGAGPYRVNFVAYDLNGKLLAQKSVTVYVAR